ncbi:MAG: hypothetical protein U9O86_07590 [Campylobacterota bacterium]|nr:hypothetical protein [Campylobacterota bacterium]
MDSSININFNVTPSQKETIALRANENGFDDISAYLKVVALKTQTFILTSMESSFEEASVELQFSVSQSQKTKIDKNVKDSPCEDLPSYLLYVALYGVVSVAVEVRSTGNLDTMLKRITETRMASKPRKLF